MKRVPAHITLDGTPLCQTWLNHAHGCQCGFRTLTAARKACNETGAKHRIWWKRLKVVRGHCPA